MRAGKGKPKGKQDARTSRNKVVQLRKRSDSGVRSGDRSDGGGVGVPRPLSAATPTWPIESIILGERARKDYGDIESLAHSIEEHGLLQPIVITPEGRVIDGGRRTTAWKILQTWEHSRFRGHPIPVHIRDDIEVAIGEFIANEHRKDLTLSERVDQWRKVEPLYREAAQRRIRDHGFGGALHGQTGSASERVDTREKIKLVTGKGARTIEKAMAIVEAAERDPAKYGKLIEDMDRNGADGAYRRLKNMQQAELLRAEPPPLPMAGPYRVIVVDPPWPAEDDGRDPRARGYYPYPTMPFDEILALPIDDIAHPEGCALWLWVNNFRLANGDHAHVLDAWGFRPSSTVLTWAKTGIGQGQRLRGASEHCVLAVRGKVPLNPGADGTWFEAPRGEHSEKPAKFFEIVERVTPASRYASLFAGKERREGWDMHGDRIGVERKEAAE